MTADKTLRKHAKAGFADMWHMSGKRQGTPTHLPPDPPSEDGKNTKNGV